MNGRHDAFPDDDFSGRVVDLALGDLAGRERAAMLAHLTECSACRQQLHELTPIVDELLLLAPQGDPPVGFESRVMRRLDAKRAMPRGSRSRTAVAVAAAILVFGAGVIAGRVGRPAGPLAQRAPGLDVARNGPLIVNGANHGDVVIMSGRPAWLFMSVRDTGWTQTVSCTVIVTSGRSIAIGSFAVSSGYGNWGAALPVPAAEVRGVDLTDIRGSPIGHAVFKP
jgi:hypothetical protein